MVVPTPAAGVGPAAARVSVAKPTTTGITYAIINTYPGIPLGRCRSGHPGESIL